MQSGMYALENAVERIRERYGDSPADVMQSIARAADDEDTDALEHIASDLSSVLEESEDEARSTEALLDAIDRGEDAVVDELVARMYDVANDLDLSGVEELFEAR